MDNQQYFSELFDSANGLIQDAAWDEAIFLLKQCLGVPNLPPYQRMMVHYNLGYALTKDANDVDSAQQLMTPQEMDESVSNYKVAANIYSNFITDPDMKLNFKEFRDNAKAAVTFFVFQLKREIKSANNQWGVNFAAFNGYPSEYNC